MKLDNGLIDILFAFYRIPGASIISFNISKNVFDKLFVRSGY